jgi:hypothetical protein
MKIKHKIIVGMVFLVLATVLVVSEISIPDDIEIVLINKTAGADGEWICNLEINGMPLKYATVEGLTTDEEILASLEEVEDLLYNTARERYVLEHESDVDEFVHPHFSIQWNETTGKIEITESVETQGVQVAEDFLIQSPPMSITPEDAWNRIDTTMASDTKSLGSSVQDLYKINQDLRNKIIDLERRLEVLEKECVRK